MEVKGARANGKGEKDEVLPNFSLEEGEGPLISVVFGKGDGEERSDGGDGRRESEGSG